MSVRRVFLIVSTLVLSWLGMMAVHELGDVLGAMLTGGVSSAGVSRTDVTPNPSPLVVVWAGPMVGVILPVLLWVMAVAARLPAAFLLRFFAGFCLIANGAYIGAGSFAGVADAGVMLRHGSPVWVLWLFGMCAVAAGLALWHRQGRAFGFGNRDGNASVVSAHVVWTVAVLCVVALALSFVFGRSE